MDPVALISVSRVLPMSESLLLRSSERKLLTFEPNRDDEWSPERKLLGVEREEMEDEESENLFKQSYFIVRNVTDSLSMNWKSNNKCVDNG